MSEENKSNIDIAELFKQYDVALPTTASTQAGNRVVYRDSEDVSVFTWEAFLEWVKMGELEQFKESGFFTSTANITGDINRSAINLSNVNPLIHSIRAMASDDGSLRTMPQMVRADVRESHDDETGKLEFVVLVPVDAESEAEIILDEKCQKFIIGYTSAAIAKRKQTTVQAQRNMYIPDILGVVMNVEAGRIQHSAVNTQRQNRGPSRLQRGRAAPPMNTQVESQPEGEPMAGEMPWDDELSEEKIA